MIELLLENLFSLLVDLSVEKISGLRKQYTNQRILYLTAEQYVKADSFRLEYRDVIPALEKDKILAIDSRDIEPSKSIHKGVPDPLTLISKKNKKQCRRNQC